MRQAGYIVAGLMTLVFTSAIAHANPVKTDDKGEPGITLENDKLDVKTLEAVLFVTLRDVINKGAVMYNNGDVAGCYRLFEGALLTVKPLLAHRPELQKTITKAFAAAKDDPVSYRRAFALRAALDKVRKDLGGTTKKDERIPLPKADDDKKPDPDMKKDEDKKDQKKDDKKPDPDDKKVEKKPDPDKDEKKVEKKPDPDKKDEKKPDDGEKLPAPKSDPDDN